MSNFPPTIDELVEEFEELEDWDERYDLIIDLGRELPGLAEEHQTEDNIVKGCMSTVWLVTNTSEEGPNKTIDILADSDSIIVKGLIVILMSYYSGQTVEFILQNDANDFFGKLGLNQHLSPQRRNGLFSMVKRLKALALELSV